MFSSSYGSALTLCLVLVLSVFPLSAQQAGITAVPFMRVPPSPSANALAGAGTALPTDEPFGAYFNPAHVGLAAQKNVLSIYGLPTEADLNLRIPICSYALQIGYNLQEEMEGFPLSAGIGYHRQSVGPTRLTRTSPDGRVLDEVSLDESYDAFTLGLAADFGLQIALGMSLKFIRSDFLDFNANRPRNLEATATALAHDFGLLLRLPLVASVEDCFDTDLSIGDSLRPSFDVALGYAAQNFGGEVNYIVDDDPLPRTSRLGYALSAALDFSRNNIPLRLVQADWTVDAEELLVSRDSLGFEYLSPFSSINPIDNLLLGQRSADVGLRVGMRLEIAELLQLNSGELRRQEGSTEFTLDGCGWALRSKGLLKIADLLFTSDTLSFLHRHFDLRYYSAEYQDVRLIPPQSYRSLLLVVSDVLL